MSLIMWQLVSDITPLCDKANNMKKGNNITPAGSDAMNYGVWVISRNAIVQGLHSALSQKWQ